MTVKNNIVGKVGLGIILNSAAYQCIHFSSSLFMKAIKDTTAGARIQDFPIGAGNLKIEQIVLSTQHTNTDKDILEAPYRYSFLTFSGFTIRLVSEARARAKI